MATERRIQANCANTLKSTGPKTPAGKRNSSMNAAHPALISGTIVLKGESLRRYNALAAALILQFQPRNSAESFLIQTMTAARWCLLRTWGSQTAGFEMEMAKTREKSGDAAGTGAVLAAVTFRSLADSSRVLTIQHRFEAAFERQYNQALAMLLKMREIPDSSPSSEPPFSSSLRHGMTKTRGMTKKPRTTKIKSKPILKPRIVLPMNELARFLALQEPSKRTQFAGKANLPRRTTRCATPRGRIYRINKIDILARS